MISFVCSVCGASYKVDKEIAGEAIRCRECSEFNRVPSGEARAGKQKKAEVGSTTGWVPMIVALCVGAVILMVVVSIAVYRHNQEDKVVVSKDDSPLRFEPPVTKEVPKASKLTAENYLRIHNGMQEDEVVLILGRPTRIDEFDGLARKSRYRVLNYIEARKVVVITLYSADRVNEIVKLPFELSAKEQQGLE